MKVEFDADEVWALFSTVTREALDGVELADEDRAALLNVLDALVAKNRLKSLAGDIA